MSVLDDFRQKQENFYLSTSRYREATKIIKDKNIVILTGHPGEGKTTMAYKLALDNSESRNCLILKDPCEWRKVDWGLKLFDTIIIDDMFGAGSLDQRLLTDWKPLLPELEQYAKSKRLRVIITTRHYILEECREELDAKLVTFKSVSDEGAVVLLSSKDLTEDEKGGILKSQAQRSGKKLREIQIKSFVEASVGMDYTWLFPSSRREDFAFGFPECAGMFVRSENMIELGTEFFKQPAALFKKYLEDLYRGNDENNEDKFLALVAIWASDKRRISKKDLFTVENMPDTIKHVVNSYYGTQAENFSSIFKKIKISLESHKDGFVLCKENTGEYMFSHNIIGDMVGVVLGKKRPDVAVELCPRDFLMEYITINKNQTKKEYKIFLEEWQFSELAEKCINMILRNNCNEKTSNHDSYEFSSLMRHGSRPNKIAVSDTLDFGIVNHKAFSNELFVSKFLEKAEEINVIEKLFLTPVMRLSGYFLDYGIQIDQMTMCLTGYAFYKRVTELAQQILKDKLLPEANLDPTSSLLLATHAEDIKTMKLLQSHGAKVTGDTLYIAVHKTNSKVLQTLLGNNVNVNDSGNIINGNTPLLVAVKKNKIGAVRILLANGADPRIAGQKKLSAIHKAVIYKRHEILRTLLKHDPHIDEKGGRFKRTPLHIAADLGDDEATKILLEYKPDVNIKDHRRHYPIHLAAIRGHHKVVKILLNHDLSQCKLRIASYGTKSAFKGMSLYHIAAWKADTKLLKVLLECKADPNVKDFYGQTALFYSIMHDKPEISKSLANSSPVDKNLAQKQGLTPLHAAVYKGLVPLVKLLGPVVNANASDKFGRTPLHVACEKGNLDAFVVLLTKCKADPRMVTKRGDTVYHILRRKNSNRTDADHLCRRAIEMYLFKKDPAFKDLLLSMPNKSGVVISSFQTYLSPSDARKVTQMVQKSEKAAMYDVDEEENSDENSSAEAPLNPVDLARLLIDLIGEDGLDYDSDNDYYDPDDFHDFY